jgi:hypothetical protein
LLTVATVVALLLGEVGLRLAGQSYYWAFAKRPDPVLGWRPPPDRSAWQRFEGEALVRTNALGFRDRNHRPSKPEDVLRIAVLGDSFTEAVQIPVEQTWWRLMEASLNRSACASDTPDKSFEVLNFAVSGYSPAQSLLAWRTFAKQFSPDVAILAFFIGNDLTESVRPLDQEPLRPYLIPTEQGLVLNTEFRHSPEYAAATGLTGRTRQWLVEHSRIAQLVLQARDALRMRKIAPATTSRQDGPQELGVDNGVYRQPTTPAWTAAWDTTEAILAAFTAEARASGTAPVLMIIGTGAQVHPNAHGRAQFAAALGVDDLGYPVRRLLRVATRHRIAVLNLPARWTAPGQTSDQPLYGLPGGRPGFGHWNQQGHAEAAEAAAGLVCRLQAALSLGDSGR